MNYADTLDLLFTKLPMYSRIGPAAYKDNLDNIIALCDALGNPERAFRSIHVAGTNGKGSTSHMLASVLQEAGYRTGLHTSPHLHDFRERIRVNGELVSEDFVVDFTERIGRLMEELEPSFFEITVAMAFDWFRHSKVDIAVIETGLGGRLDSTNILLPEVSVITNIGWDHMNLLGNTLQKIAGEKAGIIKAGVPVVIGEMLPETERVFIERAAAMNASLVHASTQAEVMNWDWKHGYLNLELATKQKVDHLRLTLDLPGIYQLKNVVTVMATIGELRSRNWKIPEAAVEKGLRHVRRNTGLAGRWEIRGRQPLLILEVAHNEAGIRQVKEQLELMDFHQLHLVLGVVKDKDAASMLELLPPDAAYYFTEAQIPRALPATELQQQAKVRGLTGETYDDVNAAIAAAKNAAAKDDVILVLGSIFLVAGVTVV